MLRGFGKFSLLLGGLSLLVASCAQGPVNPAGSDSQAMAIPMAAGEAVLVDEATKQDLIRSARLHGDFRDAESAINRSGKSLDWDQRIFGYELKGTEGESTHALVVMLKGDTEEELDDAVVSVYFKKRALAGYEVKSVLVTQILERNGNQLKFAIANLVTSTGTGGYTDLDSKEPEEVLVGTIAGRRTLEQLATIESVFPPVDTLGGRHHALPPDFPKPDDCNNSNALQTAFNNMQNEHNDYANAWDDMWQNYVKPQAAASVVFAVSTFASAMTCSAAQLGYCAAGLGSAAASAGLIHNTAEGYGDYLEDIARERTEWQGAFQRYLNQWAREGCGPFPFGEFEDLL